MDADAFQVPDNFFDSGDYPSLFPDPDPDPYPTHPPCVADSDEATMPDSNKGSELLQGVSLLFLYIYISHCAAGFSCHR